ncbi:histidine ammonia-lyase [Burkholderia pseudomultivorans]|uniref:histidine ammonia-lyase n=1 Tax=Burkholderia pseudomultivorans TaxID=1207504 RepID=UPI0007534D5A|nr:histidine ammonia-lyase [Burkholderia pseudomultivorans]KWI47624.1 histidine ammonia-lyase [Burkholderia pseudomultivorans]
MNAPDPLLPTRPQDIDEVTLGDADMSLEQFIAVAKYGARVRLSPAYRERVAKSRALVERFLAENRLVYGVTTGFGDNSTRVIRPDEAEQLQRNIVRSHAVSVGEPLPREVVRATQLMVLNSLGKGYSGVTPELLELIAELLNRDIVPIAPGDGSVGYLGPEAHMALVLIGEGEALWQDTRMPGKDALAAAGLEPHTLRCKEGLALLNGTTSVAALGLLALHNAIEGSKVADIAAALSFQPLKGTTRSLDARYHAVKKHAHQANAADNLRRLLAGSALAERFVDYRLQDTYSLRAIAQVHGASKRAIDDARDALLDEIGSSGDNPVIHPHGDDGLAISGANFDGTFVGIASDLLCIAMTNLAKISERRADRLVNPHFSELPAFLAPRPGLHSGYMIVQYTAAGLLGEMRILSHPASVDSVSTSGNQEDPVSFAYLAARKAYDASQKLHHVLAIELMIAAQALDFFDPADASPATAAVYSRIRQAVPKVDDDRCFHPDMAYIHTLVADGEVSAVVERITGALHA